MASINQDIHESKKKKQMKALRKMYQMITNWREVEMQQRKVSSFEKYNFDNNDIQAKAEHKTQNQV